MVLGALTNHQGAQTASLGRLFRFVGAVPSMAVTDYPPAKMSSILARYMALASAPKQANTTFLSALPPST